MEIVIVQSDSLINLVRDRPALWDVHSKDYNDKIVKKSKWNEIMHISVEDYDNLAEYMQENKTADIMKKWKNMRTCFTREYRKQKKMELTGEKNHPYRKRYMYYDMMKFLIPSIVDKRQDKTGYAISSPSTDEEEESNSISSTSWPGQQQDVPEILEPSNTVFVKEENEMPVLDNGMSPHWMEPSGVELNPHSEETVPVAEKYNDRNETERSILQKEPPEEEPYFPRNVNKNKSNKRKRDDLAGGDIIAVLNATLRESISQRQKHQFSLEDDDKLFLLSFHKQMRSVPIERKHLLKVDLIQLVAKYSVQELNKEHPY